MNRPTHRGPRDLLIPLLVTLAGCAVSGLSWWGLVSERHHQLAASAQESALASAVAVSLRIESQLEALEQLAALRERFGRALADWEASADLLIQARNDLACIEWIDLEDPRERLTVGEAALAERIDAAEEARSGSPAPRVAGPETDSTGALAYRVLLPAPTGEDHAGLLVAHVRLNDLLTPLLQARSAEYAVSIDWRGVRVFQRGEPLRPPRDWWHAEERLALPYEMLWSFRHEPTAELAATRLTPAPHYLFATGVALSLLLGVLVYQWRLVVRQARFLKAANLALEERGRGLEHLNLGLESRVAERTERLEEVVAELEAFNYSVSHDLRSPLGAVLNLAAILAEDYAERPLDEEGLALISRIESAALRANRLLEDLLKLSRARQVPIELENIDMNALAREIFAQVRAAQEDEGVTLVLEDLPDARGDRALIGAVLSNLFANAFKYSRGAPKREVTVNGRRDAHECVYEVADTGHGFEMRFAPKLFGLFERLHADREIEGTGVGLALVARIVKRHGGRVEAEGEPGVGACFRFSLPRTSRDDGPPKMESTEDRID